MKIVYNKRNKAVQRPGPILRPIEAFDEGRHRFFSAKNLVFVFLVRLWCLFVFVWPLLSVKALLSLLSLVIFLTLAKIR